LDRAALAIDASVYSQLASHFKFRSTVLHFQKLSGHNWTNQETPFNLLFAVITHFVKKVDVTFLIKNDYLAMKKQWNCLCRKETRML